MRRFIAGMAMGAKSITVLSWLVAAFAGALVAARLSHAADRLAAAVIGGAVLAAVVASLVLLPHPRWMAVTGVVGVPLLSYLALQLAYG